MPLKKKYFHNLLLVLGSIVVSIMLIEAALHIAGIPAPVVSGWRNKVGPEETNQLGFRGQEIRYTDGDYVVLLLGDSQVAAMDCSFDGIPERLLEYNLNRLSNKRNIRVFSIGGIGYGQDQELLLLQRFFKTYRADLVVTWFTPANDVWNNVFPTHWPKNGSPKPTYWLQDGTLKGPTEQHGEQLGWSKFKLFALINRQFQLIDRDGDWEKRLPEAYKPIISFNGKTSDDWQERWNSNRVLMRDENLATEKSHFAIFLTPVSPRMRYGMDLTRMLLNEMDSAVKRNGGNFVLFDAIAPGDIGYEAGTEDPVIHSLNKKYYMTSKRQFRDNLSYIRSGFSSITVPVTVSNWQAGPDNKHLNQPANDQVMKDLAVHLQQFIR